MYGSVLDKLAGAVGGGAPADPAGGGPPPQLAAMGAGLGAPPDMPGTPPAPTGVGAVPTGALGSAKKASADQAVMALREAASNFPNLQAQIDALIDALKAGSKAPGPKQTLGQPSPVGTPPPDATAPLDSGSSGPI
jgi:hypothetical protein